MAKVMLCAKCGIAPLYEGGSVPCPDGIAGCLVHHATIVPCRVCELLASLATLREERDALLAENRALEIKAAHFDAIYDGAQSLIERNGGSGVATLSLSADTLNAMREQLDAARAAHQGTEP